MRLIFNCASAASLLLAALLITLWIRELPGGANLHLSIGKGYYILDIDAEAGTLCFTVHHHTKPLALLLPDIHFFRTHGEGWFVDNLQIHGIKLGTFEIYQSTSDYEFTTTRFMTEWALQLPYRAAAIVVSLLPAFWLARRIHQRRKTSALGRGFDPI